MMSAVMCPLFDPMGRSKIYFKSMKIHLQYFDFTGRGEILRIMFHGCKDVEFTETRIPSSEWRTVKATLPLGQVPVLSVDGIVLTQSTSLYRFAAKLVGLYPSDDPLKALIVDESMDVLNEMISQMPSSHTTAGTDDALKTQRHEYRDTIMKQALSLVESRIEQYGAGTNTICGVPSVADLFLMSYKEMLDIQAFTHLDGTILNEYPHIVQVANHAKQHPMVVSYHNETRQN